MVPKVRLNRETKPFTNVGMVYSSPINVKIGRRTEKRWVVIFTCLAVRVIHRKIAHIMNSQSVIMAIMKIQQEEVNQRRYIVIILKITNSMCSKGIDFKFISPGAPHMCGTLETLIGSIKRIIGKIYKTSIWEKKHSISSRMIQWMLRRSLQTIISTYPNKIK